MSPSRYLSIESRRSTLKHIYKDNKNVDIEMFDKMSGKQVCAIFDSLRMSGKIAYDNNKNIFIRTDEEVKKLKEARQGWHQITLDEFLEQNTKNEKENT